MPTLFRLCDANGIVNIVCVCVYVFAGNSQDTKVSDSCLDAEMVSGRVVCGAAKRTLRTTHLNHWLSQFSQVSEDELPAPVQPKVDDAEEVSDEELPGPKLAELPADAEMVSEEELPANKSKRKNQGPDDTENANDTPNKRARPDASKLPPYMRSI